MSAQSAMERTMLEITQRDKKRAILIRGQTIFHGFIVQKKKKNVFGLATLRDVSKTYGDPGQQRGNQEIGVEGKKS